MRIAAFAFALFWAASAQAAGSGCSAFKWDVTHARDLLAQERVPASAGSEVALGTEGEGVVVLDLEPLADATPPVRPEKTAPTSSVGWVSIRGLRPGRIAVALPIEGWIDIVEAGKPLKAADFSGAKDCPGLRKVVLFDTSAEVITLQVTTDSAHQVRVALLPAP